MVVPYSPDGSSYCCFSFIPHVLPYPSLTVIPMVGGFLSFNVGWVLTRWGNSICEALIKKTPVKWKTFWSIFALEIPNMPFSGRTLPGCLMNTGSFCYFWLCQQSNLSDQQRSEKFPCLVRLTHAVPDFINRLPRHHSLWRPVTWEQFSQKQEKAPSSQLWDTGHVNLSATVCILNVCDVRLYVHTHISQCGEGEGVGWGVELRAWPGVLT